MYARHMKLRFTHHAQAQALARGISESRIADTIRRPDATAPAPGGALACRKKFEYGTLEVICVRTRGKEAYLVLTAYYR